MRLKHTIFVSYSSDAADFAVRLATRLESAGYLTTFDQWDLPPGAAYDPLLEDQVKSSSLFLFVISARSVLSDSFAITELKWAAASRRRLLGVHAPQHHDVTPPPEIAARTLSRSGGDQVANAVSEVRAILGQPAIRFLKIVALLAAAILTVVFSVQFLARRPYVGNVYDTRGVPQQNVRVAFMGLGPECPPVVTDKDGGFFSSCTSASRAINPRVILQPEGRAPCLTPISLMRPPLATTITIDPTVPNCSGVTNPAAPSRPPGPVIVGLQYDPPGHALAGATALTFSVHGSDNSGELLTYTWEFGDGTVASGLRVDHTYSTAGDFSVTVGARNPRGEETRREIRIPVRSLSGVWSTSDGAESYRLAQIGASITGSVVNNGLRVTGRVYPNRTRRQLSDWAGYVQLVLPGDSSGRVFDGRISAEVNQMLLDGPDKSTVTLVRLESK
jgi:hypothetical protein